LAAKKAPAPVREDDDEDVDSFLAGGRAMAVAAHRAQQAAMKQAQEVEEEAAGAVERERQAQAEAVFASEKERARQEEDKRRREAERKRQEEEKVLQEEERKREERRKLRQEEKNRRKEEKAARRQENGDDGVDEDQDDRDSSEDERRHRKRPGGILREALKDDGAKRMHWGESVKGRVSNDYKGMSDADLERRFQAQQSASSGEKLMTEAEVLAMLKSGRKS